MTSWPSQAAISKYEYFQSHYHDLQLVPLGVVNVMQLKNISSQ